MMGTQKREQQLFSYAQVNLEKRVRASHPLPGKSIDGFFFRA
jgi:hypothetical protein